MTFINTSHAAIALAAWLAIGGAASAQGRSTEPAGAQLAAFAREARTPDQHAEVARRYRQQAEQLDARAAEQETVAARQAATAPGIVHKWPSMAPKALTDARVRAVELRKAARESRQLAEHHAHLSVESRAD